MRLLIALILVAAAALPSQAPAAILWFGGEDTSFACIGACTVGTSGTLYRSAFARSGYGVNNGSTVADPPGARLQTPTFTASTTLWVHAQIYPGNVATNVSGQQALILRSPDGVSRLLLRQTGTNGTLKASTRNAAGTITDLATATVVWNASAVNQIDLAIVYGCTAGDTLNLYINGVSAISYTGNLCTDAATSLNQLELACLSNMNQACVSSGNCWSEVIIANEDTRSMSLATLTLQASGNTQGWTPNTLANVNKATISDATFVSDSTGNVLSQWTAPTAAPAGTWMVKSVSIEARLLKSSTGPSQFDWSWRISGANYLAGLSAALTTSFSNYRLQQDNSPATSTGWAIGEVFNSGGNQMNIGVKSLP